MPRTDEPARAHAAVGKGRTHVGAGIRGRDNFPACAPQHERLPGHGVATGLVNDGADSVYDEPAAPGLAQRILQRAHAARGKQLEDQYAVTAHGAAGLWLGECDAVVLAVKPQQMRDAVEAIRPFLARPLVLSIAAGVRASTLARWLGSDIIVRTMPNTPALIGRGMTGMAATAQVSAEQRELAGSILRAAGSVLWFDDEAQLDAVTALSGSGPAYVFYFIEALARAGAELGLTAEQSRALAVQNSSFERIIMVDALHHVIHHADSAREMFRVLKPGGILVIEEPDIRTFGVKLIALVEKILLMRSHFLTPDEIMKLFQLGKRLFEPKMVLPGL